MLSNTQLRARREVHPSTVHHVYVARGHIGFVGPPSTTGFQFMAPEQPQVLTCAADTERQWRAGYLIGQQLARSSISLPTRAKVSSKHELAADALLVGMAEAATAQQQGMKAAPVAQRSVRPAPAQRLGLDMADSGAAEVLADYDAGGSRLMESGAPPRTNRYESPVAQHQGAASVEETTRTAREQEVRRLIEAQLAKSSQEVPASQSRLLAPSKPKDLNCYQVFCNEQRPFLPVNLRNPDREKLLGRMWKALPKAERSRRKAQARGFSSTAPISGTPFVAAPMSTTAAPLAFSGSGHALKGAPEAANSPSSASARASKPPELRSIEPNSPAVRARAAPARADAKQQGAFLQTTARTAREEATQEILTRAREVRGLLERAMASQGGLASSLEGVYESGAGFGAELRKGNKRLRQTGFSSAFEAALERARWARAEQNPSFHEMEGTQEAEGPQDDAPAQNAS